MYGQQKHIYKTSVAFWFWKYSIGLNEIRNIDHVRDRRTFKKKNISKREHLKKRTFQKKNKPQYRYYSSYQFMILSLLVIHALLCQIHVFKFFFLFKNKKSRGEDEQFYDSCFDFICKYTTTKYI